MAVLALAISFQSCSKESKKEPAAKGKPGGQIGVAECDEYISKVQKCVSSKVPEASQAALKQGFEQNIQLWKEAAGSPAGKKGLVIGCKNALNAAKQSMQAFGCDW